MILINTTTKANTLHIVLCVYNCGVQEQSFACRFFSRESVCFVLPSISELFVHRHLTDDLGLDLQVAHGLMDW